MTKHSSAIANLLIVVCCLAVPLSEATAQTKFLSWLRERIGERVAKDEKQAALDAKWQKAHFKDKEAQKRFLAAMKKSRCYTCHVKGEKKKVRNVYGTELSKLLQADLKMDSKALSAAVKTNAPEELREKVRASFYECLDKSLKSPVNSKDKKSETFGERIKQGDLPNPAPDGTK